MDTLFIIEIIYLSLTIWLDGDLYDSPAKLIIVGLPLIAWGLLAYFQNNESKEPMRLGVRQSSFYGYLLTGLLVAIAYAKLSSNSWWVYLVFPLGWIGVYILFRWIMWFIEKYRRH